MTADDEPTLEDKATEFADELTHLTRGVLAEDSPQFLARNLGDRVYVTSIGDDAKACQVPISIGGVSCLTLSAQYWCCWDGTGKYLATVTAKVHVYFTDSREPLVRYEYEREWENPPGAHFHVHAHRDEMAYLLRLAERKGRPNDGMRKRSLPRLAEVHFPVGGHRLRPALEDVLLLLEREYAIDVLPGWDSIIERHMREWRILQLKAAVRDAHEEAAATLREIGYDVTPSDRVRPQDPTARLYRP
ncbi:hypothetical protein [Streptomyces sp. NPDC020917]|uniref:hypothetical protein n=1 Tax=Streptomyces sp. NPDC020917 TaxID=3365102 RepID=UPI003789599A